jgi:hypothetical protein
MIIIEYIITFLLYLHYNNQIIILYIATKKTL